MFSIAVAKLWEFNLMLLHKSGDDYPYRAEILVQLMTVPPNCWGYDRPEFSLEESKPVFPPYLSWLPLPSVPPTAPAMAQIFFTGSSEVSLNSELGIQIHWVGDAVHNIKNNSLLSVKIVLDLKLFLVTSIDKEECPLETKLNSFSLKPPVMGMDPNWLPESKKIHERLQRAQWNLIDRAIHLIFQAQASRLKSSFDAIAYGNSEVANNAKMFLHLYEDFDLLSSDDQIFQFTVERWEPDSLALAMQNLPIYKNGTDLLFYADIEIWIYYKPYIEGSENEALHHLANIDGINMTKLSNKLTAVEALATIMLRHYFLSAWKFSETEIPKISFNTPESILAPLRIPCGARLFPQFIEWLYNYLSLKYS